MMKKLILSFLMLIPFLTVSADECAINFSEMGYENAQEVTTVAINSDITLSFDKGTNSNTPKYYNTGTAVRLYGGNVLTISGAEGVAITSVVFTCDSKNVIPADSEVSLGEIAVDGNVVTWTGNANSFTLTQAGTSGHSRIQTIEVTYVTGSVPSVTGVRFSVAPGAVLPGTKVALTCATAGAEIHYTVDGSEPTAQSALYENPIVINEDLTIKAIAVKDGAVSSVAEAAYQLIKTYTSLAEILALDAQTPFVCGIQLTVFEVFGGYVFVYDPKLDEYALIFKYDLGFEKGYVLEAGWAGTVGVYGKLNQLVPTTEISVADAESVLPVPAVVTADNVADVLVVENVRKPYIFKGVTMKSAYNGKNASGELGESTVNLYNQFNIDVTEIEGDAEYDIYGILNSYNGNIQLNPISFDEPAADGPLYISPGEACEAEGYGETLFEPVRDLEVEVYEDYVIIRAFAGVEGYDLKVGIEDEEVTYVASIVDGVEGKVVESGYATLETGIPNNRFQAYIADGYSMGGIYADDQSGYVMLYGYLGGVYTYYYCYWPQEVAPLYTAEGQVTSTEGRGESMVPELDDVEVVAYEDYVVIRAFAGVEGYDLRVGLGEDDAVTYVAVDVDDEEVVVGEEGYVELPTGREDVEIMKVYIGNGYSYAGLYPEENGYVLLSCYWGADWTYYYCKWPQSEEQPWVNPFEGEAVYLYTAKTATSSVEEEEGEEDVWGGSAFPVVEDIYVAVYDKYMYIKGLAGNDKYGAKVAYDEEDAVLSIMPVVDGEDGTPCQEYTYLSTGNKEAPRIQPYVEYSYAQNYDDKSGYVLLGAYIYMADGSIWWSYYYIAWDGEWLTVKTLTVSEGETVYFDIMGNKVAQPEAGKVYIRVADGKATKIVKN